MKATKEQIVAEANRRAVAQGYGAQPVEHFIVDVVCENWTPPEPVDPDVLAFRKWMVGDPRIIGGREAILAGKWDDTGPAYAYLAGARMAREQEQADIHIPLIAVELAARFRHLLHSLPLNVRVQLGVKWNLDDAFVNGVEVALAKYRGEV